MLLCAFGPALHAEEEMEREGIFVLARGVVSNSSVSPANNPFFFFLPQLGDWITLLRTFCHTWMPNHCVLLSWCARSGTGWHRTACCGRSSSREWSGQTPCGGGCQRGEDGEETASSPLFLPFRTAGAMCFKPCLKRVIWHHETSLWFQNQQLLKSKFRVGQLGHRLAI